MFRLCLDVVVVEEMATTTPVVQSKCRIQANVMHSSILTILWSDSIHIHIIVEVLWSTPRDQSASNASIKTVLLATEDYLYLH